MAGILDGLKVLEVANWVAAPSTCAILADLGADVIKIEHPDTGDPVRSVTLNHRGMVPYTGGVNTIFELLNRGKKSLTVVPSPRVLSMATSPPDCFTKPCTMLSPRPLPCPTSLVEKKGSKTCASTSRGIPVPVSITRIAT